LESKTRLLERPSLRMWLAWTVLGGGIMSIVVALLVGPSYETPVTDFGRDLLGAALAESGDNPYQEIANLSPSAINGFADDAGQGTTWVAHSPFSLAIALLSLKLLPLQYLEPVALGVLVAAFILIGIITLRTTRRLPSESSLAIVGASALMMGVRTDLFWIQGSALVAVGLFAVYRLDIKGQKHLAVFLLGALIAWRPWLAPLALFLPDGTSPWRDAARVGAVAVTLTLISLTFVGGWDSLQQWLTVALPANLEFYRTYEWNLSLIGPYLPKMLTYAAYTAIILFAAHSRVRLPSSTWPLLGALLVLALSPLVWSHYWLALLPCLVVSLRYRGDLAIVVLLALIWPVAEYSGLMSRFSSYVALILAGSLVLLESGGVGAVIGGRSNAGE
jgi:hypothetical protein